MLIDINEQEAGALKKLIRICANKCTYPDPDDCDFCMPSLNYACRRPDIACSYRKKEYLFPDLYRQLCNKSNSNSNSNSNSKKNLGGKVNDEI